MGDLTKNLSRHELACRCGCGFDTVDFELANNLQQCVNHFESKLGTSVRIDITGGNRCKIYNARLRELYRTTNGNQGADTAVNSQHIYGRAADFKLFTRNNNNQIPATLVYSYLDSEHGNEIALGRYINRCHTDTRTDAGQRW